ncbi:unnamed protein product [Psylliodes chrysocephalus]|uniref:Uncharacterized protein n=1 Tax=Psylliodes chrysocephalus TaxID=3402493 RepID=A0A9P0D2Y8_9CUCU|nr:unnamed protein product [Psylliodes chrysocephala]
MALSRRVCVNDSNNFCFICGEYVFKEYRLNVKTFVNETYKNYFGHPLEMINKPWIPQKEEPEDFGTKNDSSDSDFEYDLGTPKPFNQDDLNDLIRDLGLSKSA